MSMDLIYKVSGGMWPGEYRSSAVKVRNCETVGDGSEAVKRWCKHNFPDWNHIGTEYNAKWFVASIDSYNPVHVFVSRRR